MFVGTGFSMHVTDLKAPSWLKLLKKCAKKIEDGDIFESRYLTYLDMLKDQNIYRKPDESSNTES